MLQLTTCPYGSSVNRVRYHGTAWAFSFWRYLKIFVAWSSSTTTAEPSRYPHPAGKQKRWKGKIYFFEVLAHLHGSELAKTARVANCLHSWFKWQIDQDFVDMNEDANNTVIKMFLKIHISVLSILPCAHLRELNYLFHISHLSSIWMRGMLGNGRLKKKWQVKIQWKNQTNQIK